MLSPWSVREKVTMVRWSGLRCCNFRIGVPYMETGNETGWSMIEFRAGIGKMNRWQGKERSWIHVVQERTIMQFLALRKAACNQYGETSCVVLENEWDRTSLWPWERLVYHHGNASSTFSEKNVRFLWPAQDEAILYSYCWNAAQSQSSPWSYTPCMVVWRWFWYPEAWC